MTLPDPPWPLLVTLVAVLGWRRWIRGLRRLVCRLWGHDSVCLGLSDSANGIEIWHACRRCRRCTCKPFMPRLCTLAEWNAALERIRRVPPAVTEIRATRKPKPTHLPGEGRSVLR